MMAGARFQLTCAAGFEGIVERAMLADAPLFHPRFTESGLIDGTIGPTSAGALAQLPYVSVVMQVLADVRATSPDDAIALLARLDGQPVPDAVRRARSFRLRITDSGKLVRVDGHHRHSLEQAIAKWGQLTVEARGGGLEFWVNHRRDSERITLGVRLNEPRNVKVPKGSLRPDVAAAVVRVIDPTEAATVLDPFAGSGAIAAARAAYPSREIVVGDQDPAVVRALERRRDRGDFGACAVVEHWDFTDTEEVIARLGGPVIDVILTDPPWGLFDSSGLSLSGLYAGMWRTIAGVLAPRGSAVVLTGARDEAMKALREPDLAVEQSFPVLVNGKKASVIVLHRH